MEKSCLLGISSFFLKLDINSFSVSIDYRSIIKGKYLTAGRVPKNRNFSI